MDHYVAYHNPDKMGYSVDSSDVHTVLTDKRVGEIAGARVWIFTGEGHPRKYYLHSYFRVDGVEDGDDRFATAVFGSQAMEFNPRIRIDRQPWFKSFLTHMGNFGRGFSKLNDRGYIELLESLAATSRRSSGKGKKDPTGPKESLAPKTAKSRMRSGLRRTPGDHVAVPTKSGAGGTVDTAAGEPGAWVLRCRVDDLTTLQRGSISGKEVSIDIETVKRFDLRKGDRVVVFLPGRAQNGGKEFAAGVYGVALVTSVKRIATDRSRVRLRPVLDLFDSPLPISVIQGDSTLRASRALHERQRGSVYELLSVIDFEKIWELALATLTTDVARQTAETESEVQRLERLYGEATPVRRTAVSKRIERGGFAEIVKKLANYECLVCKSMGEDPLGFMTLAGVPYVEAHHVYPVGELKVGALAPSNVITVCANHHRQIHHGPVELVSANRTRFSFRIDGQLVVVPRVVIPAESDSAPNLRSRVRLMNSKMNK
jgi:hypothetical protein